MIDVAKAERMSWVPITKPGGHPFVILGNRGFKSAVNSFAREEGNWNYVAKLSSHFPEIEPEELHRMFWRSVHLAKQDLSQSA